MTDQTKYEYRAVIVAGPVEGRAFATVEVQTGQTAPDGEEPYWETWYGPILTDVRADSLTAQPDAVVAAEAILTTGGFGWTLAGRWLSERPGILTVRLERDETRSWIRHTAERQMRRGVEVTGAFLADTRRCNEIAPDGVTTCNLAYNHRAMDPSDRHEYFQPMAGGRTIMSWAHCETPSCCHYAATGNLCTGHARAAGLYPVRTGPAIND